MRQGGFYRREAPGARATLVERTRPGHEQNTPERRPRAVPLEAAADDGGRTPQAPAEDPIGSEPLAPAPKRRTRKEG